MTEERNAIRLLRYLLLMVLGATFSLAAARGVWEGHLQEGGTTWIIDLPVRPIWAPPVIPHYDSFQRTFETLPAKTESSKPVIVRVLRYDAVILGFAFWATLSAGFIGVLYQLSRGEERDVVLHYGFSIAQGMFSATVACLVLYVMFGGWGPPFPLLFVLVGFGGGLVWGQVSWQKSLGRSSGSRGNP